jgi:cellulose synthase/poly-beta-1,6-N-acetylglucosamine synthase-like glycosyltransferase
MSMLIYAFRFNAFEAIDLAENSPQHSFSIIIPFRNEAEHLPGLLASLAELKYTPSLFEIILVDDHSEDSSKLICKQWKAKNETFNISILDNKTLAKSPKKSAIMTALEVVKYDYILTTDADCLLPENWLRYFNQHLQEKDSDLVAGPVKIIEDSGFWNKFQVLDLMSLQVVGLGSFKTSSPLFCNAANLCYKAETLKEIKAFSQHQDIISGDDVFNLQAFQKQGKTLSAVVHSEATVWTKAEKNFQSLTQQRIRWTSKAKLYKNNLLKGLGILVLLTNLGLLISLGLALATMDFTYFWWLWLFKLGVDFYVLYVGNQFFKTQLCSRDYFIMLLLYPFVSVYFAGLSFKGKFNWKGRKHKV